jgi:hypothetical protein
MVPLDCGVLHNARAHVLEQDSRATAVAEVHPDQPDPGNAAGDAYASDDTGAGTVTLYAMILTSNRHIADPDVDDRSRAVDSEPNCKNRRPSRRPLAG